MAQGMPRWSDLVFECARTEVAEVTVGEVCMEHAGSRFVVVLVVLAVHGTF
jgi:hypothetical protein